MKNLSIIFLIIFFSTACHKNYKQASFYGDNQGRDYAALAEMENLPSPSDISADQINSNQQINKKKIIKDGRLGLEVADLEYTKQRIDTLLIQFSGYYDNESLTNSDYESSYDLKIRIPSENFEKFVNDVAAGSEKILYKEINARDVTEEFIDLETRLKNKRNYLNRYNELLKQAKSVKDILEIEEKTRIIEEEIESAEGRLKYLSDLVAYSSLNLRISRKNEFKFQASQRANFFEKLKQSISKGWYGFIDFTLFLIRIWPFWIILFFVLFFWKKLKVKFRKNKQ